MKAHLRTREGATVIFLDLPPFQIAPEIVVWGERFFATKVTSVRVQPCPDEVSYFECFAYFVPPPITEKT